MPCHEKSEYATRAFQEAGPWNGRSGHFLVSHSISLRLSFLLCKMGLMGSGLIGSQEDWVGMRRVKGLTQAWAHHECWVRRNAHERDESFGFQRRGIESVGLGTLSWGWGGLLGNVCVPGLGGRGECGDGVKE